MWFSLVLKVHVLCCRRGSVEPTGRRNQTHVSLKLKKLWRENYPPKGTSENMPGPKRKGLSSNH